MGNVDPPLWEQRTCCNTNLFTEHHTPECRGLPSGDDWKVKRSDWPEMEEQRVIDPDTGGQKGRKKSRLASVPPEAMLILGEVYGYGGEKYEPHNYRKGYAWSLSIDALWRHFLAFQAGEDNDPESGLPHMAHVAWHALALVQFAKDHPEKDDRYDRSG